MNHLTNSRAFKEVGGSYDGPPIEALIAAILDKKHTPSAEDLAVFEALIDDPDVDPEERKELCLIIWNTVACFIDYQWDVARFSDRKTACGSNTKSADLPAIEGSAVVEWENSQCSKTYNKAASDQAGRKGSP